MNDAALKPLTRAIVLDEVFPHAPNRRPDRPLDDAADGGRACAGSALHVRDNAGRRVGRYHSLPVLEVLPNELLVYDWKGGHEDNVGYGARLDTVVTFTLSRVHTGTSLRLVHSGFAAPKNDTAYRNVSEGWRKCIHKLHTIAAEHGSPNPREASKA